MILSPYVQWDDHQMNLGSLLMLVPRQEDTFFLLVSKDTFTQTVLVGPVSCCLLKLLYNKCHSY